MASASYVRKGEVRLVKERRGKGHTREYGAHCDTAHEKPVIETTSVALPTLETNLPIKTQPKCNLSAQRSNKKEGARDTDMVATIHKAKSK